MYDCKNAEILGPAQKDIAGRADWSFVILSSIGWFDRSFLSVYTLDAGKGNVFHVPCIPSTAQPRFQIKQYIYGDKIENKICGDMPRVQCRVVAPVTCSLSAAAAYFRKILLR